MIVQHASNDTASVGSRVRSFSCDAAANAQTAPTALDTKSAGPYADQMTWGDVDSGSRACDRKQEASVKTNWALLSSSTEQVADSGVITATHCKLLPVHKVDHEVAALFGANFLHVAQIDDG